MPASLLANLLMVRETPFPKMTLISDEVGVSGRRVVEHLVQQFLQQQRTVHYVLATAFNRNRNITTDNANIHYYRSTFENYGEDTCPLTVALENLNKSDARKNTSKSIKNTRITMLDAKTLANPNCLDYKPAREMDGSSVSSDGGANVLSNLTTSASAKKATIDDYDVSVSGNNSNGLSNSSSGLSNTSLSNSCSVLSNNSLSNSSSGRLSNVVLVVEKVESVLLQRSTRSVVAAFRELIEEGCTVLLWASIDCLRDAQLSGLRCAASCLLHISAPDHHAWNAVADVTIKRSMGKVVTSHERYQLLQPGQVRTEAVVAATIVEMSPLAPDSAQQAAFSTAGSPARVAQYSSDDALTAERGAAAKIKIQTEDVRAKSDENVDSILSSQATFSLTLTEQERRAKNSLLLPHQRVQNSAGRGGLVHYTPDKEDWDEEDPDDDLDI